MHDHFDLSHALQVARRRGWIVLVSLAAALAAAYGVTLLLPERYEATATMFVGGNAPSGDAALDLQYTSLAQTLVTTYAELAETRTVAEAAAAEADLDPSAVIGDVDAEAQAGLQILKLHARASSAEGAERVANAVAAALEERVDRVNASRSGEVGVQVVDAATVPSGPVSPKPLLNMIFGGLLGLLVGIGLALARERLDGRIRTADEAERELGLPVLGVVPRLGRRTRRGEALARHENQHVAEPFRSLAASVASLPGPEGGRGILVTSAARGDGKTTVAAHLALALAEDNRDVALVEGDLRRPSLRRHFPSHDAPSLDRVIYKSGQNRLPKSAGVCPGLKVLAAEESQSNAAHVLRGPEFERVVATALRDHDYLLLDAPAALTVSDASVLARHANTVLLVVRSGSTSAEDVRASQAVFRRLGVEVAGVVLVGGRMPRRRGYDVNGKAPKRRSRELAEL